jgi:hypothetical protein
MQLTRQVARVRILWKQPQVQAAAQTAAEAPGVRESTVQSAVEAQVSTSTSEDVYFTQHTATVPAISAPMAPIK